jgi:serine/threonine protein phosphatase PrpC
MNNNQLVCGLIMEDTLIGYLLMLDRIDVAQLAANRPIEDFHSASKCVVSNAFLIGLFDGHGGAV